ncbi:tetratricopeptide repeat protein [Bradyrhizobium jicamae]|uniref:tetratricopeptide repeat protein n=1 Tax=Bradyrhizobium jicamae TaxID=280332 RepID=UPI001BA71231|nr:tetratricopeptide repeat protein [Bradyrhizobium jicamae]MBR0756432.1 tetratricopeptide repeat protein [Bradyrhizobium jicamae]
MIEEGRRLRSAGNRSGSLDAFKRAAVADPASTTAIVEAAYDHLHLVQIAEARTAFERGLTSDPENKAALIGLGHTFRHLGQLGDAEQNFRKVLALEPEHGGANAGLGYTLRSLGRKDEALDAFRTVIKGAPTNSGAKIEAANLLRDLGRAEEAITLLREVVDREPGNVGQLVALGRLLKQAGRLDEAADVFRTTIAIDPDNPGYKIELGHLLRDVDALDEGQTLLEGVLHQSPDNVAAWVALGWLHRKAKRVEAASDAFRKAVAIQPSNAGSLHALGLIERELGHYASSLDYFNQARQTDPEALYIRLEIGNTLQKLQRFDDAIGEYGAAIAKWPSSRDAHLGLGYALRSAGRSEEALAAFEKAAIVDVKHPNASIEAGHLLLRFGRPLEADQRFRMALERSPGNGAALVGLSYAVRRLGRLDEAETVLREVLAKQPDNSGARVALGHLLDALYRLDEAAELFSAVIDRQPDHADSHAALGNIHRRRGDRMAALEAFRRAADADPLNKARLVDVATELRDLGQFEESRLILDDVLKADPTDARALLQRGQLLRRQDQRVEALAVFQQLLSAHPGHAQAMVEAAAEERALGRPVEAKQLLLRALETETDQIGALMALAEIAMQSDDAAGALDFYRRAAAAHPTHVWTWMGGARAAFELGERDEAFRMIAEARDKLGAHPEITGTEIELLRHQRDWSRAMSILDEEFARTPRQNFWLWSHRVQIATMTADYDRAAEALDKSPASSVVDHARVALLRGQLAEAQFRYDDAISAYRESIAGNPSDAWAHFELARAALMNLDLETSRTALGHFIRISRSSLLLKGQSLSPSQNHVGQLLDEFVLDGEALAELKRIWGQPREDRFKGLRAMLRDYPDYTPAAIAVCIVLRQEGAFAPEKPAADEPQSPIPRHVLQFWDRDPPDDVRELMATWRRLNSGYRWTGFEDSTAADFLRSEFGGDILRAYTRTQLPAQKADLFRLAYLAARGGIYADADDRCLVGFDSYFDPRATLIVHQENYGSIGNNFIAAVPEHPVVVRALELAAAAMVRGDTDLVWLATGPGLLTRAFALQWAKQSDGQLLRRTQVLDLGELQRRIGIHCPVQYKSTDRHWSRKAFGRAKRRV